MSIRPLARFIAFACLVGLAFCCLLSTARADTTYSVTTQASNEVLTVTAPGILTINAPNAIAFPPISLNFLENVTTSGVHAVIVGDTFRGDLNILGASVLSNTGDGFTTLGFRGDTAIKSGVGYIGLQAGSTGSIATVTGIGSAWTNSSTLYVGYEGSGNLNVLAGGLVQSGNSILGSVVGSVGSATVSGVSGITNSTWNAGSLAVGSAGTGSLDILNGGVVQNTGALIGAFASGIGTVSVSGAGSTWTNTDYLAIGGTAFDPGGAGSLTVADSGLVTVGGTLKLWSSGTLTLDGGNLSAKNFDRTVGALNFNDGTLTIDGGVYTQTVGSFNINGATATSLPVLKLENGATTSGIQGMNIGGSRQGTVQVFSGSTLSNSGITLGTLSGAEGKLTVSGENSSAIHGGIFVGRAGNGTLEVLDGGQVDSGNSAFIGYSSTGTATVSGTNSSWTTGYTFLGYGGTGSLSILAGGTVHSLYDVEVGSALGSVGTATVSGAGSTWNVGNVDDYFFVGYVGKGTLNILDRGAVNNYDATLGNSGTNSSALVSGAGSTWTTTGSLNIGTFDFSSANLTVADGGLVTVDDTLSLFASSTLTIDGGSVVAHSFDRRLSSTLNFMDGHLTIDGGTYTEQTDPRLVINGATATNSPVFTMSNNATTSGVRTLVVGASNLGTLLIESGSTLSNSGTGGAGSVAGVNINDGSNYIGLAAGSTGTATVNGGTWNTGRSTYVGFEGTGELTITNGGNLSNGSSSIVGVADTGIGTVTVSGAGSTWTNSFDLTLGSDGSGTLHLLDGGVVSDKNGFLGRFTVSSSGTATVSGAGSTWSNSASLYVGGSSTASVGTGSLTVADGGLVTVVDTLKIWSTGTLNLGSAGSVQTRLLDVAAGGAIVFNGGMLQVQEQSTFDTGVSFNVNNGTFVNNGTITSVVNVGPGGLVKGSGSFSQLNLLDGGTFSPGNSPGAISPDNLGNTTWAGGGRYMWEINAVTIGSGTEGSDPGWDLWDTGHLSITATSLNPFLIELVTLNTPLGTPPDGWTGVPQTWRIATSLDAVFNDIASLQLASNSSFFSVGGLNASMFALRGVGNDLLLDFTPVTAVPEPGSLLLAGIAAGGWLWRRRNKGSGLNAINLTRK